MKSIILIVGIIGAGLLGAYAADQLNVNSLELMPTTSQSPTADNTTSPSESSWWRNQTAPNSPGSNSVTTSQPINDSTLNWAGYAASGGTFSSVSGSWTVPSSTGSGFTSADASWIGIGGVGSNDLIQVGTQNVVSPSGQVSSTGFYELLPDNSQTIPSVTVNPGDSISASITETAAEMWTINFQDNTTGGSYSVSVPYDSSLSSAEWIEEDPSDGMSQIPLDNFGTVTFRGGSATENGATVSIGGSQAQALTMTNTNEQTLASASPLINNGSFTVTRSTASSVPGLSEFNQYPERWARRGVGISRQYSEFTNNVGEHT